MDAFLKLFFVEHFGKADLARAPEPALVMDNWEHVTEFHAAGASEGMLIPIYYFNALSCGSFLPQGARVLDLGSGSGRYLEFFGKIRPDLEMVGLDLSRQMVELGNQNLKTQGLFPRIHLEIGDMTDFLPKVEGRFDLVSTIFALHHLPTMEALEKCCSQIGGILKSQQSSLWVFDHIRPRTMASARLFHEIFMKKASAEFQKDSFNSTLAAWSFKEMQRVIRDQVGLAVEGYPAHIMPFWQVHRYCGPRAICATKERLQHPLGLSKKQIQDFNLLRTFCFPALQ